MTTKISLSFSRLLLPPMFIILFILSYGSYTVTAQPFPIKEATISDIQFAFYQKQLTSRELVEFYLNEIEKLNPLIKGVIEVNPDALNLADKADHERQMNPALSFSGLHGIPTLVKDNIGTKDKMNNTSGSYALLGSVLQRDSGVVAKLREAGAIIFGKASVNEWSAFRSSIAPSGWSARGGYGKNPYVLSATPCGSSSGSGISTAANLATVSLGTETNGSILCPANYNSIVGIKPTVCLVSMDQVVPISSRQDTLGPMCRTVDDAVRVLDVIAGMDYNSPATRRCSRYIPRGGYKQFLRVDGLRGKRIGIVREPYFSLLNDSYAAQVIEGHFQTLRQKGAILIDNLQIPNIEAISDADASGERGLLFAEYKITLNAFLQQLKSSPVRSIADVIAFNKKNADLEKLEEYGQDIFEASQKTKGIGCYERRAMANLERLSKNGFERVMRRNRLDALVTPGSDVFHVLAIGGYPGINVPAGYNLKGVPFGITFAGLKFTEPKLIEVAYAYEQATKVRKPPTFVGTVSSDEPATSWKSLPSPFNAADVIADSIDGDGIILEEPQDSCDNNGMAPSI